MTFNTTEAVDSTALPSVPKRKKTASWLIWLLMALMLGGGGFLAYRLLVINPTQKASSQSLTVAVERQSLPITITANGSVKPERSINVSPKTSGILRKLLVKEGDRVKQGQILAYMDNSNLQGQLTQAKGQLAQAEANLQKLEAGNRPQDIAQAEAQLAEAQANLRKVQAGNRSQDIAQAEARVKAAEATLSKASDDLLRQQNLYQAGAVSLQTVNQKRADKDNAQAQVNEAKAALGLQQAGSRTEDIQQARARVSQQESVVALLKAGTRREEINAARAQVMSARGSLQSIQAQINDTIIRAPFESVVVKKYADPGAFVTPTTSASSVSSAVSSSVLSLASTNQVVANLAEASISKVSLGQKVLIRADAFPRKTFTGKVSQIAAQASVEQNVTSFEVKVTLEPEAEQILRSGMNVSTEFQVGNLNNAIVVPTAAVVRRQRGTGVFVMGAENKPVFTRIETGVTVNNKTEVRSGLKGNEKVLLSFPQGERPESQPRSMFSGSSRRSRN
ncbi:efflux RND transporter periplasmic adaptor subunit [Calothrix sp. 336/3]|uniref:efflux RND transporter periplasmic adaptor subunit n=1 Tax=Calothrix sp. 336/3 TaxID=1337936 RepID=UPI0004E2E93B|nr:efflux RND transporter periplasmic adaptor subunit [Calothrix sp. 336/3]AKG21982.1 RND transporter [Calothrix sp. 336/3]